MSSARNRNVRQRKLNTKQGLRIIREHEIDNSQDDEASRQIPQLETGVEKGEEIEVHLQAVINANNASALLGANAPQSYIPTPDAVRAKGVKFDELYPKVFTEPATYIRFSSTVEECTGIAYCMNEDDAAFLAQLNQGKDANGQPLDDKYKSKQCSEDTFEEVMNFFEEVSKREQPYANLGSAPILRLDEMEKACDDDEPPSADAQRWMSPIYDYWAGRKGDRALMPSIKVRVLDATSEADEADPYVCFRRREVRQTRKTRGRDAQVVEKLKKLRQELEQGRNIVEYVRLREEKNKDALENLRTLFNQRHSLKEVKITKQIIGEKGEDEELLVNQKPLVKTGRSAGGQQRPTLRLGRSIGGGGNAPENDLSSLADIQAENEAIVNHTIESRKDQHRRWNKDWQDRTWDPLTPPADAADATEQKWAPLFANTTGYPTPPPSLPSRSSHDRDGDIDMADSRPEEQHAVAGAETEYRFSFSMPQPYPMDTFFGDDRTFAKRYGNPSCRIRHGRGGRLHLEAKRQRLRGAISRGVVSDSESDDDIDGYYPVAEAKAFDYRCALNASARPSPNGSNGGRPSGDQTAIMPGAQAAAGGQTQQAAAGNSS